MLGLAIAAMMAAVNNSPTASKRCHRTANGNGIVNMRRHCIIDQPLTGVR